MPAPACVFTSTPTAPPRFTAPSNMKIPHQMRTSELLLLPPTVLCSCARHARTPPHNSARSPSPSNRTHVPRSPSPSGPHTPSQTSNVHPGRACCCPHVQAPPRAVPFYEPPQASCCSQASECPPAARLPPRSTPILAGTCTTAPCHQPLPPTQPPPSPPRWPRTSTPPTHIFHPPLPPTHPPKSPLSSLPNQASLSL